MLNQVFRVQLPKGIVELNLVAPAFLLCCSAAAFPSFAFWLWGWEFSPMDSGIFMQYPASRSCWFRGENTHLSVRFGEKKIVIADADNAKTLFDWTAQLLASGDIFELVPWCC